METNKEYGYSMDSLILQLVNRGYDLHEATRIVEIYQGRNKIEELSEYLKSTNFEYELTMQLFDEMFYQCY